MIQLNLNLCLIHKLTRLIFEGLISDTGKAVPKTEADVLVFLEVGIQIISTAAFS